MRLRTRLLAFTTAQLVVFGCAFAVAYLALERYVLPVLEENLHAEALADVDRAARELDVGVGASDRELIGQTLAQVVAETDFAFVDVRDASDVTLYARGERAGTPFAAVAGRAVRGDDDVRAWLPISLEGMRLGRVEIGMSTARVDGIRTWTRGIALVIGLAWLAMLGVALAFSRAFLAPIHAMIAFSRKLAAGAVDDKLAIPEDRSELADLAADLDAIRIAQRRFVEVSRIAGMAEVATGVLHDVGNVLNSLNISVSVAGDQIRDSKLVALQRTAEMLAAHGTDPASFLASERGKIVPAFLVAIAKRLGDEQAKIAGELAAVAKHVEHLKAIVVRQQQYAQVTVTEAEPLALQAIVDDALAIGQASFERHGIEVVRDIAADLPTVVSDRHKVLQILVNLVNNARQAVKEAPTRKLVVRAARSSTQRIAITVVDSGVGIAPEHVERVFQHGFTTKRDGHGFGLHASANAARQLGGALSVASAGLGAGATFKLELPLRSRPA